MKSIRFALRGAARPLGVGLLVAAAACSGGSSPSAPASPPVSPTPTPPTSGGGGGSADAVCRSIGYGEPFAPCDNKQGPSLLPLVEAAIDQLAAKQPSIFNTEAQDGPGGYQVLDVDRYYQGMISTLAGMGVCASTYPFAERLQVKNTNEFSESYDILNSKQHVRRGHGAYYDTCTPPAFPLAPDEMFVKVRVSFFGINCDQPSFKVPTPAEGRLPVVCSGIVTATPLDANGIKTPPSIHGNDVTWRLRSGEGVVSVYPALDGNIFNYIIQGLNVGTFSLCATVKGMEGCLNGEVYQP